MKTQRTSLSDYLYDRLLWPILKIFWEPFSKKRSHWWHWKTFWGGQSPERHVTVIGKNVKNRDTFWTMLTQTNFVWKNVVILKPVGDEIKDAHFYQVGYIENREKIEHIEICSILIPIGQAVGLLVGPNDITFFAINANNRQQISLKIINETTKNKLKNILLL
ncbi:MAG: hypothetical protein WC249_03445 [Patescibacteria group bacterium]|jgi:hypothetical protein